jgi:quercetin dioxygenase-like cupin family protein
VVLGPGDALLNPPDIVHGFRNEGPQPVIAQFMVGHPKPLMPKYKYHPSSGDGGPEFGKPLVDAADPKAQWLAQYVMRAADITPLWVACPDGGRLAHQPYMLPKANGGFVDPGHFSVEMLHLSEGCETPWYQLEHEVAFMVWDGMLRVDWRDETDEASAGLGKRDLVQVPPMQTFRLTNPGMQAARAVAMLGTPAPRGDLWSRTAH